MREYRARRRKIGCEMRYTMVLILFVVGLGATSAIGCSKEPFEKGPPPLLAAVVEGDLDKVAQLLESGADTNAVDENGNTALHIAAEYDDVEMIQLLAKHGADFSIMNYRRSTPGDWAERQGMQAAERACRELGKR